MCFSVLAFPFNSQNPNFFNEVLHPFLFFLEDINFSYILNSDLIILISESSVGLYLLSVVSLACPSQWTFFQQKDQGVFQGPTQISASPAAGFLFNSLALQLLSSTEFLEVLTWTCMT